MGKNKTKQMFNKIKRDREKIESKKLNSKEIEKIADEMSEKQSEKYIGSYINIHDIFNKIVEIYEKDKNYISLTTLKNELEKEHCYNDMEYYDVYELENGEVYCSSTFKNENGNCYLFTRDEWEMKQGYDDLVDEKYFLDKYGEDILKLCDEIKNVNFNNLDEFDWDEYFDISDWDEYFDISFYDIGHAVGSYLFEEEVEDDLNIMLYLCDDPDKHPRYYDMLENQAKYLNNILKEAKEVLELEYFPKQQYPFEFYYFDEDGFEKISFRVREFPDLSEYLENHKNNLLIYNENYKKLEKQIQKFFEKENIELIYVTLEKEGIEFLMENPENEFYLGKIGHIYDLGESYQNNNGEYVRATIDNFPELFLNQLKEDVERFKTIKRTKKKEKER